MSHSAAGSLVHQAVRRLLSAPAYSASIILTLTVGLAAITFVSAIGYGVLLRPLPMVAPEQLLALSTTNSTGRPGGVSLPDVDDWRHQTTSFQTIGAWIELDAAIETPSGVVPVRVAAVDHQFFDALGVSAAAGRGLTAADDHVATVVPSSPAWERLFGGSPNVVGSRVTLNGEAATVVGVASPSLTFPDPSVQAWVPLVHARETGPPQWAMRGFRGFHGVARLRPGVTLAAAGADLLQVSTALSSTYPRFNAGVRASATSLSEDLAQPVRPALLMLWAGALLLLLTTCVNAATLTMTGATRRQQEWSVRSALGASPRRLALEPLIELGMLASVGCVLGFGVAGLLVRWFVAYHPEHFPRLDAVRLDTPLFALAAAMAVAVTVLTSLPPALRAAHIDPADTLKEIRGAGRSTRRTYRLLVAAQVALSVALSIGTLLVSRQLAEALSTDLGSGAQTVVTARLDLTTSVYARPDAQRRFVGRVLEDLRSAGIVNAGLLSSLPPVTGQMRTTIPSAADDAAQRDVLVDIVAATPAALTALGVPLRSGRAFSDADAPNSQPVAILSAAAAQQLFPRRDAIGLRVPFGMGPNAQPLVVGIVGDVPYRGFAAASVPAMYLPATQRPFRTMYFAVNTSLGEESVAGLLRQAVQREDPALAVGPLKALTRLRREAASDYAFRTAVTSALAVTALLLAAIGIYGVTAQSAMLRRRELAVRTALGSQRRSLLKLVVGDALRPCAIGGACGVGLAFLGQRLSRSSLTGVPSIDLTTVALALATAILVSTCVALIPAWRAIS